MPGAVPSATKYSKKTAMKIPIKQLFLTLSLTMVFIQLSAACAFPSTYYIDWSNGSDKNTGISKTRAWKRAPGMRGFTGTYSHSAGDTFIFKGGVSWPAAALPLKINYSGDLQRVDTYTTDHTWHAAPAWSQPVFDGGGTMAGSLIIASGKAFLKIDDIKLVGIGIAFRTNRHATITLENCNDIEVSNTSIASENWEGIYAYNAAAGATSNNFVFHDNDISHVAMGIVVAPCASGAIIDNVHIYNNKFHDFSSQLVGGVHGDGIHTWGVKGDQSAYIRNISIYNNQFYGDWSFSAPSSGTTAFIFLEDTTYHALIYNNSGTYSSAHSSTIISRFILISSGSGIKIYNNTMRGTPAGVYWALQLVYSRDCDVKNNIFSNVRHVYSIDSASLAGLSIDYNNGHLGTYAASYNGQLLETWAQWRAKGFDIHGISQDPLFVSPESNLGLQPESPCIGKGMDLSSVFRTDLTGTKRSAPWSLGAIQFSSKPRTTN